MKTIGEIKTLQISDVLDLELDQVIKMDEEEFVWKWSRESWESSKANPSYKIVLQIEKEEVISWCLYLDNKLDDSIHLLKILVSLKYRSSGFANKLMEILLKDANEQKRMQIFLEVEVDNLPAISLYEKFNFKIMSTKKKFYASGKDAYFMIKLL